MRRSCHISSGDWPSVAASASRSGSIAAHGSGEIFLTFSTANAEALGQGDGLGRADFIPDAALTPLFEAAVRAIEEAVVNALVANETMTGRDGHSIRALPHDAVRAILREHNRLAG